MNIDDLKQILEVVREHEISDFELEEEGFKLRIRKRGLDATPEVAVAPPPPPAPSALAASVPPGPSARPTVAVVEPPATAVAGAELAFVKSPIVGTFYRAPEPGARPFVDVGTVVRKGQVLCIIEAMKLMNEINSEHDGEVVSIDVENGQAVQYGERLFAIKCG
jgi:acetyl-CoA carboxylase biotin carboxyl carrier protein